MNRTEEKLLKKQMRKKMTLDILILFLCLIFFMLMIYITDVKTSELMVKNDGRHAVFIEIEDDTILRVDIVGKTIRFNIGYLVDAIRHVIKWLSDMWNKAMNSLGS